MKTTPLRLCQLGFKNVLLVEERNWISCVKENLKPDYWRDRESLINLAYKIFPNMRERPSGNGYVR